MDGSLASNDRNLATAATEISPRPTMTDHIEGIAPVPFRVRSEPREAQVRLSRSHFR